MEAMRLLVLRLTERCNLQCAYYYAARDGQPFDMDADTAIRAVEACCPPGGRLKIQFTGGEPILKLDVMEAVCDFGRRTGRSLSLSVQTNGTLLTPDVCRRLNAMRCGVGVSLDGVAAANALRRFPDGTPSFDAAAAGIRALGREGMRCGLTAVVTKCSAASLGQLADLALYFGNVSGVGLDLFRPIGRGAGQDFAPDADALEVGLRALKEKAQALSAAGVPFRFRELERIRKRSTANACFSHYCYAQTDVSLCIDGRGDIWPCSSLAGDSRYLLGNLADGLPQTPRSALCGLNAPSECRKCEDYARCLGGCPAARQTRANPLACQMHRTLCKDCKQEVL